MYRSPGTASSPDLATLLRKARERSGSVNKSPEAANTTPSRPDSSRSQARSSISSPGSSPILSPAPKGKLKANQLLGIDVDTVSATTVSSASPEWVWTSPRSLGNPRNAKSSVRQKTSAFLGKMLGQTSTRERSRTITSSPSTTSIASISYPATPLMDAFTPPVPPLPSKHKPQPKLRRHGSADVFSDTSDVEKSLPAAPSQSGHTDADDFTPARSRSPSPATTLRPRQPSARSVQPSPKPVRMASRSKRRSMSVSDADIKKVLGMAASSSTAGRTSAEGRKPEVDTSLNGIISDFAGEFSPLDSISTGSLDLRDPSAPGRPSAVRAHSDDRAFQSGTLRPSARSASSSPAQLPPPRLTLQPADSTPGSVRPSPVDSAEGASLPTRTTSLYGSPHASYAPLRSRSGSSATGPVRLSSLKQGPRAQPVGSGSASAQVRHSVSRDGDRLRAQHRSKGSTSEPSLIPPWDRPSLAAGSQQDLTTSDMIVARYSMQARRSSAKEDVGDLEVRGKELAARCWAEDEEFLPKDKIAEWLGGQSLINKTALRYYIDNFDFSNMRLDFAFRKLCGKLYLKAETQQVDRILEEFARRFFECNPTSILGSASVVHAVTYSLLLLNTDLHVADLVTRMSRGQFVRNTISTIQMQLQPNRSANSDVSFDDWSFGPASDPDIGGATIRRAKRSDSITSWNSVTTREGGSMPSPLAATSTGQLSSLSDGASQAPKNSSTVSLALAPGPDSNIPERDSMSASTPAPVSTSIAPIVHDRNWENEVENLLKEMYNAVKNQQILQPLSSTLMARSSTSSLSPHGPLLRQRSLRGGQQDRLANLKRGSIRGLQSILHTQSGVSPYSSNSSIEGRSSPAPSFANSIEGMHASTASFLTPAMGFASNLSHTIIRETQEDDSHSVHSDASSGNISITDEELALLGPPWAKEGMLCRKQYYESTGKRAKSKTWMDVFVVIQRGELSMFVFGEHAHGSSSVVGGGNWLENAQPVGKVLLAHSLAHALPPPGYNRQRPHCMVLTLANGGTYFFQAGTEELVNEWVSTCNYWAARQSKEPLAGGVSNMEYGWNRVLDPITRVRSISEDAYTRDADNDNVSVCSGRSGRSRLKEIAATVRAEKSPWVDRTVINEWKPPMPPTVPSTHDEETQLEALQRHVASLKDDLKQHNELRTPMMNLYQPRSSNASKAMGNWEKKSQYLLTEIVKYESYIDSLQMAMALRLKRRGEKALERALIVASPTDSEDPAEAAVKGRWKGQPEQETIEEGEEPPVSAGIEASPVHVHRRELAEADSG
ncbi:hypothetical protein WOLCODRAFT_138645 [Wolfiporia cocos MD-104 SS10]|uniref:SEC7 domain-containing protein n=1 Tax=Wolfiporia cocos (strain MD-104) TaxID=742152 RepID=A0A2H3JNV9_WOLCO|nr:hypothetical protein WOLCODRAFT_138645 [Wolfiporia cocos MD-104 SS10]